MTKEEILKSVANKSKFNTHIDIIENKGEEIHEAMDDYAKQEAIAFAEFLGNYENGRGITPRIENGRIVWYFFNGESVNAGDTNSVWELYLKSK